MIRNTSGQKIGAQMVTAADGSAFTGAVTVYVTGDAGTQAAGSVGSGACTHEGNGYHTYAPDQAETNYDLVAFTFTGTGAIPATVQIYPKAVADGVLTAAERNATADALLNRDMSAVTVTNARSPINALRFLRNKWSVSGATLTVTTEDDVTEAWTASVTTNAAAVPVTGSDPA